MTLKPCKNTPYYILVGTTFKPIHGYGMGKIIGKPLDEDLEAFLLPRVYNSLRLKASPSFLAVANTPLSCQFCPLLNLIKRGNSPTIINP